MLVFPLDLEQKDFASNYYDEIALKSVRVGMNEDRFEIVVDGYQQSGKSALIAAALGKTHNTETPYLKKSYQHNLLKIDKGKKISIWRLLSNKETKSLNEIYYNKANIVIYTISALQDFKEQADYIRDRISDVKEDCKIILIATCWEPPKNKFEKKAVEDLATEIEEKSKSKVDHHFTSALTEKNAKKIANIFSNLVISLTSPSKPEVVEQASSETTLTSTESIFGSTLSSNSSEDLAVEDSSSSDDKETLTPNKLTPHSTINEVSSSSTDGTSSPIRQSPPSESQVIRATASTPDLNDLDAYPDRITSKHRFTFFTNKTDMPNCYSDYLEVTCQRTSFFGNLNLSTRTSRANHLENSTLENRAKIKSLYYQYANINDNRSNMKELIRVELFKALLVSENDQVYQATVLAQGNSKYSNSTDPVLLFIKSKVEKIGIDAKDTLLHQLYKTTDALETRACSATRREIRNQQIDKLLEIANEVITNPKTNFSDSVKDNNIDAILSKDVYIRSQLGKIRDAAADRQAAIEEHSSEEGITLD